MTFRTYQPLVIGLALAEICLLLYIGTGLLETCVQILVGASALAISPRRLRRTNLALLSPTMLGLVLQVVPAIATFTQHPDDQEAFLRLLSGALELWLLARLAFAVKSLPLTLPAGAYSGADPASLRSPHLEALAQTLRGNTRPSSDNLSFFYTMLGWILTPLAVVTGLFGFYFERLASRLRDRGRRLRSRGAHEVLELDPRPPVLLLRPFEDDDEGSTRIEGTFEQHLVNGLSRLGPVLTIGNPYEEMPLVGAARAYADVKPWHELVTDLLNASQMIVIVLGSSKGLLWEINTIREFGLWRQCLFVVPFYNPAIVKARWTATRQLLPELPDAAIDAAKSLFLSFTDGGDCVDIVAAHRRPSAYRAGLALLAQTAR